MNKTILKLNVLVVFAWTTQMLFLFFYCNYFPFVEDIVETRGWGFSLGLLFLFTFLTNAILTSAIWVAWDTNPNRIREGL